MTLMSPFPSAYLPVSHTPPPHLLTSGVRKCCQRPDTHHQLRLLSLPPPPCLASIQRLFWLGNHHGRDLDPRSIYEGPFLHHIVNRYPQHSVLVTSHRELLSHSAHTTLLLAGKSVMWGWSADTLFFPLRTPDVPLSTVPDPFSLGKSGNNRANALPYPR